MTYHWFTTERMTCVVGCEEGVIQITPPILRKFKGQPIENLRRWLSKQPGFDEAVL